MMKMRQCICVMVAFSLFLLNCIETGWASEKKPVLDDDGNVVTEGEIEENMGDDYRISYIRKAVYAGLFLAPIGGVIFSDRICSRYSNCSDLPFPMVICSNHCSENEYLAIWLVSTAALETATIITSYYIGKQYDRRQAIERIKAQRRKQKKHAFDEQEMTGGGCFQLLKVTF